MKNFKRFVAMVLLVCMLCAFAVPVTFAETPGEEIPEETTAPAETFAPDGEDYPQDGVTLVNLEFTPITIMEHSWGGWDYENVYDENGEVIGRNEFYRYDCGTDLLSQSTYTATFSDGTQITGNGDGFDYNGRWYQFSTASDQSYYNQWTVGNTYTFDVWVEGQMFKLPVTIEASPLLSISFSSVTVTENTGGWWDRACDEFGNPVAGTEYYRYDINGEMMNQISYIAFFNNGEKREGWYSDLGFEFGGVRYDFTVTSNQSYDNQWTAGNEYAFEVSVMGKTAPISVSIVQSPLESITFTPITVMEKTHGGMSGTMDPETGEELSFFEYYPGHLCELTTYTATFKDGAVYTGIANQDELWHNGIRYGITSASDQSYYNQWTVGNTYSIQLSVAGKTVEVPVEIVPSPLVSLTFEPLSIMENTNGYMASWWNEETGNYDLYYYEYMVNNLILDTTYTATFSDGTVLTGRNNGFEYKGTWYHFDCTSSQGYYNQWTADNTYAMTVSVLGMTVEIPVTITGSPLESLTFAPVSIMEGTCGSIAGGPGMNGEFVEFYHYSDWEILNRTTYTATFRDGTILTGSGNNFFYNGQQYYFTTGSDQGPDNQWTAGNDYAITVTVLGKIVDIPVTITASPLVSLELTPVTIEKETCGMWENFYNPATGAFDLTFYRYNASMVLGKSTYTATFRDGTVLTGSANGSFMYDGMYYSFSTTDNQSYENQWISGNTYTITVSVLGQTAQVPVTICESVTSGGYKYLAQNGMAIITDCTLTDEVLQLPDTIDGLPVVGVYALGTAMDTARQIIFPDSVRMLSNETFVSYYSEQTALEKLTLGSGISDISMEMLWCAGNLAEIAVSEDNPNYCAVEGVLYDKALTQMIAYPPAKTAVHTVPDSVTDVEVIANGADLFAGICIRFGAGVTDYVLEDGVIYSADMTRIILATGEAEGKYVMPDTVTEMGPMAFANSKFTEVTISSGVTAITYYAFGGSACLEKVHIPDSVIFIEDHAFQDCSALKTVNIPSSVRGVYWGAYLDCKALEEVHITDLESWCNIYFSDATANPLTQANNLYVNGEKVTQLVIPETVTGICYSNFSGISAETVTFPENFTTIGREAFAYSALTSVTVPDSVYNLGYNAFDGCTNLQEVTLSENLYTIPTRCFAGTAITSIVIPQKVEYIGWSAFENAKLREVTFNCENLQLSEFAFKNCPIWELELGENVTHLGWQETFGGTLIASVTIPDSVTELTYGVFGYNKNLVSVTIPRSIEMLSSMAFTGDKNLSHVLYTGTKAQWNGLDCWSTELNNATIHCGAKGNEVTVEQNCEEVRLYCSICDKWEILVKEDHDHDMHDGVCTYCGPCQHNKIEEGICVYCQMEIGSVLTDSEGNRTGYATFTEALDALQEGQTISMYANAQEEVLVLPASATLDLNGHTLAVDSVVTFKGNEITDNSEDASGLLQVSEEEGAMISPNNAQLPVYDQKNGGFRFFEMDVISRAVTGENTDNPKYWFKINTRNFDRFNDLVQAGANLQIKVKMTWDDQEEPVYAAASVDFLKVWAESFNDNPNLYITVSATGAQEKENFTLTPCVVAYNVEISGDELN